MGYISDMEKKHNEYQIAQLIYKSVANILAGEEKKVLDAWLEIPENRKLYQQITSKGSINKKIALYKQLDTVAAFKKLEARIQQHHSKVRKLRVTNILRYAAVFTGILLLTVLYRQTFTQSENEILVIPEEQITLTLENGVVEIIAQDTVRSLTNPAGEIISFQKGTRLQYDSIAEIQTLTYNTLTVPYGKRFEVVLSDGTHVFLNSGTSFRYPINFIKGQNREVFLKGEAYFKVTEDTEHPFIVNSGPLRTQVLGTQFNISSYSEDESILTVLVEGSVKVYNEIAEETGKEVILQPGQKAAWSRSTKNIVVNEADIELHTAWIDGRIVFKKLPFRSILKKLERHYNVTILSHNKALDSEMFRASFDIESIEEVMESFNRNYNIDYTIKNNQIIIN